MYVCTVCMYSMYVCMYVVYVLYVCTVCMYVHMFVFMNVCIHEVYVCMYVCVGGCGVVVYFRKEGRSLGEVTKYLVYNMRKRAEVEHSPLLYIHTYIHTVHT